jgi:hypothetical protein
MRCRTRHRPLTLTDPHGKSHGQTKNLVNRLLQPAQITDLYGLFLISCLGKELRGAFVFFRFLRNRRILGFRDQTERTLRPARMTTSGTRLSSVSSATITLPLTRTDHQMFALCRRLLSIQPCRPLGCKTAQRDPIWRVSAVGCQRATQARRYDVGCQELSDAPNVRWSNDRA